MYVQISSSCRIARRADQQGARRLVSFEPGLPAISQLRVQPMRKQRRAAIKTEQLGGHSQEQQRHRQAESKLRLMVDDVMFPVSSVSRQMVGLFNRVAIDDAWQLS